jgi:hypothetical protein
VGSDKGDLAPEPGSSDCTICSAASAENAHRTANGIPSGDQRYFAANGEIGIVRTNDHHFWFKRRLRHQILWLVRLSLLKRTDGRVLSEAEVNSPGVMAKTEVGERGRGGRIGYHLHDFRDGTKKGRESGCCNALANWQDSFDDDIFPQKYAFYHIFNNAQVFP